MKNQLRIILLVAVLVAIQTQSRAQWTIDPNNPTAVCDVNGWQNSVQSFPDSNGGVYIFWMDGRVTDYIYDVYGQHYNAEGIPQWETNGREIISYQGNVESFHIIPLTDGSLMAGWCITSSTNADENGVYIRKMNGSAESMWEDDIKVRNGAYNYTINLISSGQYLYACIYANLGIFILKMTHEGELLWPYGGSGISGLFGVGSFACSPDQNGGLYFYHSTGNGSGAALRCMKIAGADNIQNMWSSWAVVTEGSYGLSYQFSGIGDSEGISFIWQGGGSVGTGENLYARRLSTDDGSFLWDGETKEICIENGSQHAFTWRKSGDNYYIVWADARPGVVGNFAIYGQKLNIDGTLNWGDSGMQIANLNTSMPNPKLALDENNNMVVVHQGGGQFVAHKVQDDGTVQWGSSGITVLSGSYTPNLDYNLHYSQGKYLVASVKPVLSGGNDNIYLTKIAAPVQETETTTACNTYTTYGETFDMSGTYIIEYHPDTILTLNLTIINNVSEIDVDGTTLIAINDGGFQWYNCDTNQPIEAEHGSTFTATESGNYALQLTNGECVDMSDCVQITIVSIKENSNDQIVSIFPNPSNGQFTIDSSELYSEIIIYNLLGEIVYTGKINSSRSAINITGHPSGIYYYRILNENQVVKTGEIIIQ